jgi:hypothetical protein
MFLPKPDKNPTFAKEKERLGSVGIPTNLIDVTGDGNCLFYCMLNFLLETGRLGTTWREVENPVMHMRHLLCNLGKGMKQSYWTYLSGYASKEVRLCCLYDEAINYMDREFMMKDENANNLGEIFDAAIFARAYHLKVVLYLAQTEKSYQTQLYDCSQFNRDKNVGLVFSAKNGLHPENVPAGPNVVQLITYFTDTEDTPGGGAKHSIRVATPPEPYEPEEDLGNTVDYGIVELEAEIEGQNKNDKTVQENIKEMALELKVAKERKGEEDIKKKKSRWNGKRKGRKIIKSLVLYWR